MHGGDDLFQLRPERPSDGSMPKEESEALVHREAVGRQFPIPSADDGARGKGELHPFGRGWASALLRSSAAAASRWPETSKLRLTMRAARPSSPGTKRP